MSDLRYSAHAKVTVTIEVAAESGWGAGTTMDQVHSQSAEDVLRKLGRLFQDERIRVIGTPKIEAIITTYER